MKVVDHFQLVGYEVNDARAGNAVVLVSGTKRYYAILRHAFSEYHFSRAFDDNRNRYDWGTYIYDIDEENRQRDIDLLELFKNTVFIDDALNQTFALSYHSQSTFQGIGRTETGELVYQAKPYHRSPSEKQRQAAARLVELYEQFIRCHPSYLRSDFLIAVPPHGQKPFDLPTFLVERLSKTLGIPNGQKFVSKVRSSSPMKDCKTVKEKSDNIRGAFRVSNEVSLQNKLVTIIDDIYQSGSTLHELGTTLQNAGAVVQGLVATKTLKDPD
ncbi:MAG: hypothetical protein BroJett038_14020 [Chloroflexota bacterium]|nr:MAG: hypothetical protein BroJett038_14020 [Chloroflexota bacterium]